MDGDLKIVKLTSEDGDTYEVPINVAKMSKFVTERLGQDHEENNGDEQKVSGVPLPNVSSPVLEKVIEYCTHYQKEEMTPLKKPLKTNKLEELVQQWYVDFVNVPKNVLFELVNAANTLQIKPLLDLTCLAIALLLNGKSESEMREIFAYANTIVS